MANRGPVIIVEDDADDEAIFNEILKELNISNNIKWFGNSDDAIHYLKTTTDQPFIIFSDVNLPGNNGIELKRQIDKDKRLRKKSIPFVFYSTAVDRRIVNEVYTQITVQGFFKKGNSYEEIRNNIKLIFDYWQICKHPKTK
jgi:response regulator RpfG family c-di-GMP phosphodiesterase